MSSAVAILIIPHLGWSNRNLHVKERFGNKAAPQPPDVVAIEDVCRLDALPVDQTCLGLYSIGLDELSAAIQQCFEITAYYYWSGIRALPFGAWAARCGANKDLFDTKNFVAVAAYLPRGYR